jgi:hypothetical protein
MRRWLGALLGLFALLWVSYAGTFIYRRPGQRDPVGLTGCGKSRHKRKGPA